MQATTMMAILILWQIGIVQSYGNDAGNVPSQEKNSYITALSMLKVVTTKCQNSVPSHTIKTVNVKVFL